MRTSIYVAIVIVGLLFESAGLGLLVPFIDGLATGGPRSAFVLGTGLQLDTTWLLLAASVAITLRACVHLGALRVGSGLVNGRAHEVRTELHRLVFEPGAGPTVETATGTYLNVMTGEAWSAGEYRRAQLDLAARTAALSVFGIVLALLSWRLTALLCVALTPFAVIGYTINRRTRQLGRAIVGHENVVHEAAIASLSGSFTVSTFGLVDRFVARFETQSAALRDANVKIDVAAGSVPQLLSVMMIPASGVLFLVGRDLDVPISQLVVFIVVLYRSVPQGTGVMSALSELFRHRAGLEAVRTYLSVELPPREDRHWFRDPIDRIEIRELSFGYPESPPLLEGLSTTLHGGRVYRIAGDSGVGKSTLVSLILGLLVPSGGRVEFVGRTPGISGEPRVQVGYAGQRSSMFEDTLEWNLYLGRTVSEDRKRRIEQDFGIADFVGNLPDGMATRIKRRGDGLSGGQLQRLQVARAVCGQPSLLILDEATSELDIDSERQVMDAVLDLCPEAIILIVSHRSTPSVQLTGENIAGIDLREVSGARLELAESPQ